MSMQRLDSWWLTTLALALVSVALAVQLFVVISTVLSFFPMGPSPLLQFMYPRHQALVMPEREMELFRVFVISAAVIFAVGHHVLRRHAAGETSTGLFRLTLVETVWTLALAFSIFKMFVYGHAGWTKVLFYSLLVMSVLSKVFFKELCMAGGFLRRMNLPGWAADCGVVLGIAAALALTDIDAMVGRMFMTDHFYHLDAMLTAPGWAFLKGGALNVDHFSAYAIGAPVIVAGLLGMLNAFSYQGLVVLMMTASILYYAAAYLLLRSVSGMRLVSAAAVVLMIKWQMFHPGVAPTIYNYPSASVLRYPFDLLFFYFAWCHLKDSKARWYWAMAVTAGVALFHMIDTGFCLAAVFLVYAAWRAHEGWRSDRRLGLALGRFTAGASAVMATTVLCLSMAVGRGFWTAEFWINTKERGSFFFLGHGNLPIYQSLLEGKYLSSLMGFLFPLSYVLLLLISSAAFISGRLKTPRLRLLPLLCIYGLLMYNYYICRSAETSYYAVIWPWVFALALSLSALMPRFENIRRFGPGLLLALSVAALVSTHAFLNYPNVFNFSRSPHTRPAVPLTMSGGESFFNHTDRQMNPAIKLDTNSLGQTNEELRTEADFANDKEFKDFVRAQMDVGVDAELIRRLTAPDEPVALISSYELLLLMRADRRPFFYFFPLVETRPLGMRTFVMTTLWTVPRLERTLNELEARRPKYIFLERILARTSVPGFYAQIYPELLAVLDYVQRHYTPTEEGRYLVAMRRRDPGT